MVSFAGLKLQPPERAKNVRFRYKDGRFSYGFQIKNRERLRKKIPVFILLSG